jgi:hypothetical protein
MPSAAVGKAEVRDHDMLARDAFLGETSIDMGDIVHECELMMAKVRAEGINHAHAQDDHLIVRRELEPRSKSGAVDVDREKLILGFTWEPSGLYRL